MNAFNRLAIPDRLAWAAALLAAAAALAGLFVADLYRDNAAMVAQARGTDLVTLLAAVPLLACGLWLAAGGSRGGRLLAMGALGYLAYSYAIFAFQVVVNAATPLHIAVLGLSAWSLVLGVPSRISSPPDGLGARLPRRTTAAFLLLIVLMFGGLWLGQIAGAITSGILPTAVRDLDLPTSAVYALDLAFALPLLCLGGTLLLRHDPRGTAVAVAGLVFVVLMALSILGLFGFQAAAGMAVDASMSAMFGVIAALAMALAALGLMPDRSARIAPTAVRA